MSQNKGYSVTELPGYEGHDFGWSEPECLDQARIDAFAACTGDHQWIHVDQERAARESPFGGTIAHGFLVLSLIATKQLELGVYPTDAKQIINYGLNSVRFLAPVPAGSSVRVSAKITKVEDKGEGRFVVTSEGEVKAEGADKPAIVAEQVAYVMA